MGTKQKTVHNIRVKYTLQVGYKYLIHMLDFLASSLNETNHCVAVAVNHPVYMYLRHTVETWELHRHGGLRPLKCWNCIMLHLQPEKLQLYITNRDFNVLGPHSWINLLNSLRSESGIEIFKGKFKNIYF